MIFEGNFDKDANGRWYFFKRDPGKEQTESFTYFLAGILSQWYASPFYDYESKLKFLNCEQYMMYAKAHIFGDKEIAEKIMSTDSPSLAKKLGRKVKGFDESLWTSSRKDIVKRGNFLKFTQNEKLRNILFQTEDSTLVEVNPKDKIWGIGLDSASALRYSRNTWQGLNLLGEILTEVREELRNVV
jgi:ribA/ribD-fused uncharacterized protein